MTRMTFLRGRLVHLRGLALITLAAMVVLAPAALTGQQQPQQPPPQQPGSEESFRFRSGVELVNVTATVTDGSGRFVPGLTKDDFVVYEDGVPQTISHFSSDRVPVSLGVVLDTSGSMAGEKFSDAQFALNRFLSDLLDPADEMFLYRFSGTPQLVQDWTSDRQRLRRALGLIVPAGGTAMYDAIADSIPVAQAGKHRKKAIVIISDGNDTSSRTEVPELKQMIRGSEVMVYAIGIDGPSETTSARPTNRQPRFPPPTPMPFPIPGRRRPTPWPQPLPPMGGSGYRITSSDRVNVAALRELTDDSGGRTEIIRSTGDLNPATANIADELSRQYYLGYQSSGKHDGRWHSIRVELRNASLRVRARRGYVAS
jgi:Ca-activated chloride channel homolog